MTNFMQQASRLAMIAVLGAAPLAVAAQDDAVKPADGEVTTEAPQTDAAQTEETVDADAAADATETDTEVETDTAGAAEADAEVETDSAEMPATDDATDTATAPASDATDTAEMPMTDDPAAADTVAEAPVEEPAKPVEGQITMQSENTILAEDLIGSNIYSDAGEKIGDVDDLIVNLDGSVEGVVIGVGGFLGIGEKWVAVKMDSLSTMTDESGALRLVSSATKADLEAAEAFKTAQDMKAEQQALESTVPQDPNAAETAEPVPAD
ncbi:PRC-barrel domain-containing protein [Sulfitobacter sp. S0837]|uniref:PRC-barrel domain-containing protein n=1 Tax=Sulfitobacter maritimus TaxID=2741719 RepID=UPI0015827327|nr:PRC-barrel domain-containing protein [Sulfitobacter maritimus]NUH66190.1 PRC-barrel domain-containing protein [Sulfitobacter maritimus]